MQSSANCNHQSNEGLLVLVPFGHVSAAVGKAIGLPVGRNSPSGRFELGEVVDFGSLRTGGATDLWLATENAMLVQQRGRWANIKNMNIDLQELAATTLLSCLPSSVRQHVFGCMLMLKRCHCLR